MTQHTTSRAKPASPERIAEIFDAIVTSEAMMEIFSEVPFPITGKDFSDWCRANIHACRKSQMDVLAQRLVTAYRDEGFLAPCPNNGPRNVGAMTAWNDWLEGVDLEKEYRNSHLLQSAAAQVLPRNFVKTTVRRKMRLENDGEPAGFASADDLRSVIEAVIAKSREAYIAQTLDPYEDTLSNFHDRLTGDPLRTGGTLFEPVLVSFDTAEREFVPCPVLDQPPVALEIELSLPSGELVMADWFRVKGFKEGLDALVEEPGHGWDLNSQDGMDARMRAYYELAGLVIVACGNNSPYAHLERPGVWRMGHIIDDELDEDAEVQEEAWTTCTDLWANVFADRQTVLDVMMASGVYAERAEADAALQGYIDDTWGATAVKLGVDRLHVYAPTGFGEQGDLFDKKVRFAGFDYGAHRWDAYVLSAEPLTPLDPSLFAKIDWVERPIPAAAEHAPAP